MTKESWMLTKSKFPFYFRMFSKADVFHRLFKISSVKSYKPWLQLKPIFKMSNLYEIDAKYNQLIDVFVKKVSIMEWKAVLQ